MTIDAPEGGMEGALGEGACLNHAPDIAHHTGLRRPRLPSYGRPALKVASARQESATCVTAQRGFMLGTKASHPSRQKGTVPCATGGLWAGSAALPLPVLKNAVSEIIRQSIVSGISARGGNARSFGVPVSVRFGL